MTQILENNELLLRNVIDADELQRRIYFTRAVANTRPEPLVVPIRIELHIASKCGPTTSSNRDEVATVKSVADADAKTKFLNLYIEDQMSKAGSKKAYVETLSKDNLRALLICKNVAGVVAKAIFEGDCSGLDFVDDAFVETVFDDETKKKYNISKMNMMSFNKVRCALLRTDG